MRPTILLAVLFYGACLASVGHANENAALVLHAVPFSGGGGCGARGFSCDSGAAVSVDVGAMIDVHLLLLDANDLLGVQVVFEVPIGWSFQRWDGGSCQANVLEVVQPSSTSGELAMVFDAVRGGTGEVIPVGTLTLVTAASGCLLLGESTHPGGTHIIDDRFDQFPIPAERRGSICVGAGGIDACEFGTDLQEETWGAIKERYDR